MSRNARVLFETAYYRLEGLLESSIVTIVDLLRPFLILDEVQLKGKGAISYIITTAVILEAAAFVGR